MQRAQSAALGAILAIGLVLPGLAHGAGTTTTTAPGASYLDAKAAVEAGQYAAALPMLAAVLANDPSNADVWNLLGFASRKLGRVKDAETYYAHALQLAPDHLGALEYQGELFLETGRPQLARANLDQLLKLCGANCEQYRDLAEALAAAGQS